MTYEILTVPCLTDNFAFILKGPGGTAVIDAPEAGPIIARLEAEGLTPDVLLLTHHHDDHIAGAEELRAKGAKVWGAKADAHRLPKLDVELEPGKVDLFGDPLTVIEVSGHTVGHVAFYHEAAGALFSGDSLMAMGCGRLFEGTPDQMWQSLRKLRDLPDDTTVCSGHEYTQNNARFALTVEPTNPFLNDRVQQIAQMRTEGKWTVPSMLGEEKKTNPFLRADLPEVKSAMGMDGADDTEVFAAIRKAKDDF